MKNMNLSLNFTKLQENLSAFLWRFHTIIFFLFLGVMLIVALSMIVPIIYLSNQAGSQPTSDLVNGSFDEDTIRQLDNLTDNGEDSSFNLPSGRTNPFVE